MRYAFLTTFLLAAVSVQAADRIELAQYQADVDDVVWQVGVDGGDAGFGDGVNESWGLQYNQVSGSVERKFKLGSYRLSGIFDIYHRQSLAGTEFYDSENAVSFGPGFSFTPNTATQFFYSLSEEQSQDDLSTARWGGDSSSQRTGLSQTWFFARQRAQITLGYEFEQGDTEDIYDDLRAHSVVFSSRFPLFWGLSARLKADYAQNSYLDYLGSSDVESDRQLFQATIDHSFTRRLYGEFQFSYLNEEFDDADLSYRRYVWGLNLRYRY